MIIFDLIYLFSNFLFFFIIIQVSIIQAKLQTLWELSFIRKAVSSPSSLHLALMVSHQHLQLQFLVLLQVG